jgi:uncharacterized protein (TIGR03435 family)
MNPNFLSKIWDVVAAALGNHLWQSTLFALAAGLLTFTLRKNQARARYWLWLAASLKFLIPFSWLMSVGNHLGRLRTFAESGSAASGNGVYVVVEEISQPFTPSATSALSQAAPTIVSPGLTHMLPALLVGVWLCGFVAVLVLWCVRWRRISAALRSAVPLLEGREVEALRQQERIAGIGQRVEMLLSRTMLEPGIFGMARPVLVWPEGISEHLENEHLEAILAHELWHVRRRDNLAAAIHMVVEAIFWFHPLVWWLGSRLVDERERACDEEVVELGSERRLYAESILKVCEFCVGSPLACVSGVTGADLKKRMVHIMSEQIVQRLDLSKKLLLAVAGLVAIAAPIVFGLVHAAPVQAQSQSDDAASATFDKVSITPSAESTPTPTYAGTKNHMVRMMFGPDRFLANNVTLHSVIEEAYSVQDNQIVGGPDWLNTATFDIEAKVDHPDGAKPDFPPNHEKDQKMLQTLLADYTQLALHSETRQLQSYALVVAEGGSKLQPSQAADSGAAPMPPPGGGSQVFIQHVRPGANGDFPQTEGMRVQMGDNQVVGVTTHGISMADLTHMLSRQLGVPVIDKTGLKGTYSFNLQWKHADPAANAAASGSSTDNAESLFTAIQEQLGLKLEPQKGPTPVLVIDHIEKPTEN